LPKRHCLDCGTLTPNTRCPTCTRTRSNQRQRPEYEGNWRTQSQHTRTAWVATHGWWCPGWDRTPHESHDLVVDHDVGVLCRSCNGAKAGGYDKRKRTR
jgi:hypothetical protein